MQPAAGELDFQADEAFLEAMMAFVLSIPAADVWQDAAWEARQRRLLTAQFGPRVAADVLCDYQWMLKDTKNTATQPQVIWDLLMHPKCRRQIAPITVR